MLTLTMNQNTETTLSTFKENKRNRGSFKSIKKKHVHAFSAAHVRASSLCDSFFQES